MSKPKALWMQYQVTWEFPGNLFSSTPKNPDLIEPWLQARKPKAIPPNARSIDQVQAEVVSTMLVEPETLEEQEKRVSLGFQYVEGAIHQRGATVRAHMKDCARIVGKMFVGKVKGEAMLGWKITNGLYVNEYWIPVTRPDGTPITQPDGNQELMVHAMGPTGPVNALKQVDYVTNVKMVFTINLLCGLHQTDLETIMQYGAMHGYAGERSMGEGRYVYTIEKLGG